MIDHSDGNFFSGNLLANRFEVHPIRTFHFECDQIGIDLIQDFERRPVGLHLGEHPLLRRVSPTGVAPHFGLLAQSLYGIVEDFQHEIERDVFVGDRPRSEQVKLRIFDLDHGTTGIGKVMQFLVKGVTNGHDPRRQVLVVFVLNSVCDQFRRNSAELGWPRGEALRRLPYFGILHFAWSHRSHDLRHDPRFQIIVEDMPARKPDSAGAGACQLRVSGFEAGHPQLARAGAGGIGFPRGHILHDYLEARVMPKIVGPVGPGEMQYAEIWKAAQRLTPRPAKFGTVAPELVAYAVQDEHYKDLPTRIMAVSDAFNKELHDLADAGCPVIQIEDPQLHLLAARPVPNKDITLDFMLKVFNNTVKGLREKTEVWCHTCWGNPSQQRMFAEVQTYRPALEVLNQVDADLITFEMKSSNGMDLEAVCKQITGKKIAIGVIDHHTLQVETPQEVAGLLRQTLKYVSPERLAVCTDCGMGREGMSRRHAFYKTVALVRGTNIVRKELGIAEAECLAADPRYSFIRPHI